MYYISNLVGHHKIINEINQWAVFPSREMLVALPE